MVSLDKKRLMITYDQSTSDIARTTVNQQLNIAPLERAQREDDVWYEENKNWTVVAEAMIRIRKYNKVHNKHNNKKI